MRLWEFEPHLVAALNRVEGVTATSFRDADVMLLYGVVVTSRSGVTARVRLTASGDRCEELPAVHVANIARVEEREEPRRPAADMETASKVESLLDRVLSLDQSAGMVHVMTFRDRRAALKLGMTGCGHGVVVTFTNGAEVFATVTA